MEPACLVSAIQGPAVNAVTPIRPYADPPTRFPRGPPIRRYADPFLPRPAVTPTRHYADTPTRFPVRASRRLASSMVAMVVAESLIPYGRISRPP